MTAEKMGIPEEDVAERLAAVQQLLHFSTAKMTVMGPDRLAQLSNDPSKLAQKLVTLKRLFPTADTSSMVKNEVSLVLRADLEKIAVAATELRSMLPGVNVDRYGPSWAS